MSNAQQPGATADRALHRAVHRDSQWVVSAVAAAPVAALVSLLFPLVGAPAALAGVVLAVVAIRQRPAHHRGLVTTALVVSAAALLWSLVVLLVLTPAPWGPSVDVSPPAEAPQVFSPGP